MCFTTAEVLDAHSVSITKSDQQILPPTRSGSVSGLKKRPSSNRIVVSSQRLYSRMRTFFTLGLRPLNTYPLLGFRGL